MFLTCGTSTTLDYSKTNECLKDAIEESANYLKANTEYRPKIGIICGSGLGSLSDALENPVEFPYPNIPNFPTCTVQGHEGKLIFGKLSDVPVICMKGRFHLYEGYPLWKCTLPVRIMKQLGVKLLITTNAAGGLNKNLKNGDVMIIQDHIDLIRLFGHFSLRGPGPDLFDFHYSPVNILYSNKLIEAALRLPKELG
ncbi:hypothetical protein WA026_005971 [Henosepilachna vigintioctopunctata]|uniref:purine-nucleoside phosphorylase n=1 Tax=Henosepilachna vigintioctopunctata TaxID=420089 RepID=A0AAW1U4Z1_9CUCU